MAIGDVIVHESYSKKRLVAPIKKVPFDELYVGLVCAELNLSM